jgi:hypothetical protein
MPTSNVFLPLVSPGNQLRWRADAGDYRLVVPTGTTGKVQLEIYSPMLNLKDYAFKRDDPSYIGDERYSNTPFYTRFRLRDARNTVVGEKTFAPGNTHTWAALLNTTLKPGIYPLEIRSSGNGKNAFGLNANGKVRLEASQFSLNARGAPGTVLTAATIPVSRNLIGQRVRISNYDGDGLTELELWVNMPSGQVRKLSTSGDLAWASNDIQVTAAEVGTWKVMVRIGSKPRQFSNGFALRFRLLPNTPLYVQLPVTAPPDPTPDPPPPPVTPPVSVTPPNQPEAAQPGPVRVDIVDQNGKPVDAAKYTVTGVSERAVTLIVPDGFAPLESKIIDGEGVAERPDRVLVGVSGATIRFVVRLLQAQLNVQVVAEAGDTRIPLPDAPVWMDDRVQPSSQAFTLRPGRYTVQPIILPDANAEPVTVTLEDGDQKTITLVYRIQAQLKLEPVQTRLEPGQDVVLTATASTTFPYGVPISLRLALPAELQSSHAPHMDTIIQAGRSAQHTITARAIGASPQVSVQASLEPFGLTARTAVEIVSPPAPQPAPQSAPPPTPPPASPPPPTQADLELTIDPDPLSLELGTVPLMVTLGITNAGSGAAENTRLRLPVPDGVKLDSWSVSQGKCAISDGTLECALERLEPGARALVLLVMRPERIGPLNGTARASADTTESSLENNTASFVVIVNPPPPPPARLVLTRTNPTPGPALPGELVTVKLILENAGGVSTEFILTDDPGALLRPETEPRFDGTLAPGERREFTYMARVQAGSPESSTLTARAEAPDLEPAEASTNFRRVNMGLVKTADITVAPRPDAPIPFVIRVENPLERSVRVQLQGDAPGLNLTPDESAELELGPREVRVLRVTGTATAPGAYTNSLRLSLDGIAVAPEASASVTVIELPSRERRSEITLNVRVAQTPQGDIIITDRVPAGANYVPGSSRLNAQAIPDPLVREDRLFWVFPGAASGSLAGDHQITYQLEHTGDLVMPDDRVGVMVRLPNTGKQEPSYRVLSGSNDLIDAFKAAQKPNPGPAPRQRIGALIVNPASGTLFRDRDQVNITVDVPLKAENIVLSVNGNTVPDARVGTRTFDEGTGRLTLEYVAVKLQPGSNQLVLTATFEGQSLEDRAEMLVSGPATQIRIAPATPLTSDPNDRPALRFEVLDANGLPAQDGVLTIETTPEPNIADANPNEPGLQVRFENGVAVVPLSGIGFRTVVRAEARIGPLQSRAEFPVQASSRPTIMLGVTSVELRGSSLGFSVSGSLQGFLRTTVLDTYLLTVGLNLRADSSAGFGGNLLPPANEFTRYPLLGDDAQRGADTNSSDGLFARLEQGPSFVMYGQHTPGFAGRLTTYGTRHNGLQILHRSEDLMVTGFVALEPRTDVSNVDVTNPYGFPGDGTNLYRLASPVEPGTERVRVVVRDQNGLTVLRQRELERGRDYALDAVSGIITLTRPLERLDESGNPQFLVVEYTTAGTDVPREWRFGTQARFGLGEWMLTGTALQYSASKPLLAALGLGYSAQGFRADAELAWSGDWALSATASYRQPGLEASLSYQNVGIQYVGPGVVSSGSDINFSASLAATPSLKFSAGLAYGQRYTTGESRTEYSLQAQNDFGGFSASLGLRGFVGSSLNALGGLVWNTNVFLTGGVIVPFDRFKFGLEQRVPLSAGTSGQTVFSVEYALSDTVKIEFRDTLSYDGTNQGSLGVRGSFGTTNVSASYDLPGSSGDAGRGRVGLDTTIPLGDGFSAQLGGSISASIGAALEASLSFGLAYQFEQTRANAAAQFSITPRGLKQVYSAGLVFQPVVEPLVLSPKLEITVGPEGSGLRFSAAGAYRGAGVALLTNHQARTGVYAPNGDSLEGEVQGLVLVDARFTVRGGLAYKLSSGVLTGQVNAGATNWITPQFGLGANLVWAFQPGYAYRFSFGLEASWRVLPELMLTGGVNILGFDNGLGSSTTAPGFYVRFDWIFDERSFAQVSSPPTPPAPSTAR